MSAAVLSPNPRPNELTPLRPAAFSQVSGLSKPDDQDVLPLPPGLGELLPDGGLRRGRTLRVGRSTSLLLALLAEASRAGAWCAAVGIPDLGVVAAARAGVDLDRFALVPAPGASWSTATAALLDAIDVVVVAPPRSGATPQIARRLSARARERRAVLLVTGPHDQWERERWEGADAELSVVARSWDGVGEGHGHLRECRLEVRASGRRVGGRPRTARLHLADRGAEDERRVDDAELAHEEAFDAT